MRGSKKIICESFIPLLLLIFFLNVFSVAFGAEGFVVYYKRGCDYFIVQTSSDFALLEWYGGHEPHKGCFVMGSFERYGFADVSCLSHGKETRVYVEEYWLPRESVLEKYFERCK